jgi:hypothetical protein
MTKKYEQRLIEAFMRCEAAYKKNPLLFPFKAIMHQIQYLIDLEQGKTKDLEPLKKIKIGWIAVRELDGFDDQELINLLCSISTEAEKKYYERGKHDGKK